MPTYTLEVRGPMGEQLLRTQRSNPNDVGMWVRDELLNAPYVQDGCSVTVTVVGSSPREQIRQEHDQRTREDRLAEEDRRYMAAYTAMPRVHDSMGGDYAQQSLVHGPHTGPYGVGTPPFGGDEGCRR